MTSNRMGNGPLQIVRTQWGQFRIGQTVVWTLGEFNEPRTILALVRWNDHDYAVVSSTRIEQPVLCGVDYLRRMDEGRKR